MTKAIQHLILWITLATGFTPVVNAQTDRLSYGLSVSLNYPTIGTQYSMYSGEGNATLGMFLQYRPQQGLDVGHPMRNVRYTLIPDELVRRLSFMVQPSFSINSFRHQDVDRRYTNYYLEVSGLVYLQPFTYTDEFTLFTGIRPSLLTAYSTELFEFGYYVDKTDEANLNRRGRIDVCVPFGFSLQLSEAVGLEMAYVHSFTNNNTSTQIQGRPSSLELSLKLNALGLVNQFSKKDELLRKQITTYSKGSMLVLLPTPNPSEIKELKKTQSSEDIQFIYTELKDRNKKVMREFRANFDFCPVYFFMDTSAYKVVSKNFNNIFVNSNLEVDPAVKPDSSNFFVSGFCDDISLYTGKHQYGLFVYDDKIIQLPKPFNVPINLVGPNLEGDPLNFFKKKKFNYSIMSFDRIIRRFSNRLHSYKDQ